MIKQFIKLQQKQYYYTFIFTPYLCIYAIKCFLILDVNCLLCLNTILKESNERGTTIYIIPLSLPSCVRIVNYYILDLITALCVQLDILDKYTPTYQYTDIPVPISRSNLGVCPG